MTFDELINAAVEREASDLLLVPGAPPTLRADGEHQALGQPLGTDVVQRWLEATLDGARLERLRHEHRLDFAVDHLGRRFRASAFHTRGQAGLNLRLLPSHLPNVERLGLPPALPRLMTRAQGLVLVTGASGQGKSTTQAALLDLVNRTQARHVVTLEDPIEFVHASQKSVIDQRELGRDFTHFHQALMGVLRQRPDVVLVGEIRDVDTMRAVLAVAETGHLVLSTLHTGDAVQAVPRIVESFPPEQQRLVRGQLSSVLSAVINQRLVRDVHGKLTLATEVLVNTPAMARIIREGHDEQLYGQMELDARSGNRSMNHALDELVAHRRVLPAAVEPFVVMRESRAQPKER